MAWRRIHHGETDSTNERALCAVERGEALHGDVHVADAQTAGRGRRGRTWESPRGEGLYVSAILFPDAPAPHPAAWTMAAGLAVADTARSSGVRNATLKWPNDVLAGNEKLAGILVETRGLDPMKPHAVVGIGFNRAQTKFPDGLRLPATSLALLGHDVPADRLLDDLLNNLAARLDPLASDDDLCREYVEATELSGSRVRATGPEGDVEGDFASLALDRGLTLNTARGAVTLAIEHLQALARV